MALLAKKPLSQVACKSLLASEVACKPYAYPTDTLLICLWDIDSLSDTDMRWEIRYTQNKWLLRQFVWSCEKKMEKKKLLWIFPKTVFLYESVIQESLLGCDGKISDFIRGVDSLSCKILYHDTLNYKHYFQLDWISQSKSTHIIIPITQIEQYSDNKNYYRSIIQLFQQKLISIEKKTTVKN